MPIITAENLGKKYLIGHQSERESYTALRDVIAQSAKQWVSKTRQLLRGEQLLEGDTREEFWALQDLNFEIEAGDRVGIIGRNGAGKSTLLKILSRITEPTTGRVVINGRVASLLEVGTGFHPELSGRENIYLNGAILGMSRAEIRRKFDEIVAFAGVEKFIDTPVKRYSSGMYVRLAFSVAAHLEPEILVVDEVLAVGDAEFQKKCLGKMEDVSKNEGRTVLFVSHNMGAIEKLCEKGILLENGIIKLFENINNVLYSYSLESKLNLNNYVNLVEHSNRSKNLYPYLTFVKILSDDDEIPFMGSLRIALGYNFEEEVVNPQFCIKFLSHLGQRLATLVSAYQNNEIPNILLGKGEVICEINALSFLPGTYSISLQLWVPGQKLDEIEDVIFLTIKQNKDIPLYKNWNSGYGLFYIDATWTL